MAVYFDPYVEGGTAVITDADGENPNEILCVAQEAARVPQFAMADGYDDAAGYARRRAFSNAVRTEYRALGIAGTRLARASELQDGRGNLASVAVAASRDSGLRTQDSGLSPIIGRDLSARSQAEADSVQFRRGRIDDPRLMPGNNQRTAATRPGAETPAADQDFDRRLQDADAYEEQLRATGAIT